MAIIGVIGGLLGKWFNFDPMYLQDYKSQASFT